MLTPVFPNQEFDLRILRCVSSIRTCLKALQSSVIKRTGEELIAIRGARTALEKQLNHTLTLQNQVSQMDRQISDVVSRIQEAEDWSRSRLFEQDSRPLWKIHEIGDLDQAVENGILHTFDRSSKIGVEFLRIHKIGITCLVMSYFLVLLGAVRLRRHLAAKPGFWEKSKS